MAKILNAKKRKCDVLSNGPIPELGFVTGPVYNCNLVTDTIVKLVSNGRRVYEINPNNPKDKVLLTVATCSTSAFDGEVVEKPEVVVPVVEKPEQVVMTASKADETDPHKIFLAKIGKTEDEWRQMSKSERKRLKLQYGDKSVTTQNVNNENEGTKTDEIPDETPVNAGENNPVVENTTVEETPAVETPTNEEVTEVEPGTEEAVESADM